MISDTSYSLWSDDVIWDGRLDLAIYRNFFKSYWLERSFEQTPGGRYSNRKPFGIMDNMVI